MPRNRAVLVIGTKEVNRWVKAIVALALVGESLCQPVQADCLDDAANYWGVPVPLARAIAMHESGMRPNAVGKNTNGSRDIGLMQINSWWLPSLAKYGIREADLFDACKNAYIGNWIMAQNILRFGLNWDAVGAYNATTPAKREVYARKIYAQLLRYQAPITSTAPNPYSR